MSDYNETTAEDDGFLSFVKAGLEEGVSGVPRLAEIERAARPRAGFWRYSWLAAAASVAVVASFFLLNPGRAGEGESNVAQVIELLYAADGAEGAEFPGAADGEGGLASMILAWQDVPYESAISGLASN